jgi:transposase
MTELINLHCQSLSFDPKLSARRLKKAQRIFPIKILHNIIFLSLYLLGMKRSAIASTFGLSPNTVRTKIRIFLKEGASALFDRRKKNLLPPVKEEPEMSPERETVIEQTTEDDVLRIGDICIAIPKNNHLQARAVLLTLVQNGIITKAEAAESLNLSLGHIGYLCNELKDKDIQCLLDQRQGQKEDYKFTPEVKAQLIQIFTIKSLTGKRTSGKTIGEELEAMFGISFSERSVRFHMLKLGLSHIKRTLPVQYALEKKTV